MAGAAAGNKRRHLQVLHGTTLAKRVGEDLQNPIREYLGSVLPGAWVVFQPVESPN
jgi:hypothetical protein